MGIRITGIAFNNEFRGETTDWLLGNIGDKMRADINVIIVTEALGKVTLRPIQGVDGDNWIVAQSPLFKDFRVGDTIKMDTGPGSFTAGTYTIIQKSNDLSIQVNSAPATVTNQGPGYAAIYLTTPSTGFKFFFNMKENSDAVDYFSLVDGSEQLFINKSVDASSWSGFTMLPQGLKAWQIRGASIAGNGIQTTAPYGQQFLIKHFFYITPFFLADQWDDLLAGNLPSYLAKLKTLKYIFRVEALQDFNNPNNRQFNELTTTAGNVGWFDENFNGTPSNYLVSSVTFAKPDTSLIPAINLSSTIETTVTIVIQNATDAPFSNNNTMFTLNFIKAPEAKEEYQNNNTMDQNFLFDRVLQTVGATAANGDMYGTNRQVLKNVSAVYNSASQITITAKISLNTAIVSALSVLDFKRYILFVAVQNHTLNTKIADKVSLLVHASDFFEDFTADNLVRSTTVFLRHPHDNAQMQGVQTLDAFPEDEIISVSQFYIDRSTLLSTDIIDIKKTEVIIKAKNNVTGQEFNLFKYHLDFNNLPIINGNQFIDYSFDRNYHVPANERTIRVKRRPDLDVSSHIYYDVIVPFLFKWEYWQTLTGVNGAFFDITQANNGFNNFWQRYNNLSNWGIYHQLNLYVSKNGHINHYQNEVLLGANNYNSNPDFTALSIKAYDNITNALLYDGGSAKNYILGYKDSRIEASFTKISAAPDLQYVAVVFGIEIFEQGGEFGRRRLSSVWFSDGDSWLKSTNTSTKVTLSLTGSTIKATCLIDFTKIPLDKSKFKITARLYDLTGGSINGKITEAGVLKITENGNFKILN
jgi:hypothetical protein